MANYALFHKLVDDAKTRIREVSATEAKQRQESGAMLIDVREAEDFAQEHAEGAVGVSRGVLEMKIGQLAPNDETPIICYCGGGSRSALAAESLQRMGYKNVASLAGGFKAWREQNLPTTN